MSFDVSRWRPGPLLPGRDVRDGALIFVIAVLTFLACLTLLAALGADRAAKGWTAQLTGSATIVVRPSGAETPDAAAARAAETLAGLPGVSEARAMEKAKAEALIEPWVGKEALLDDLPVPRLVTLELDPAAPPSAGRLNAALKAAGLDAVVDDHRRWIDDLERSAATARLAAGAVFALIAAAAAAVVAFATRAGLAAHHEVVEVLHLSGARGGYVAGLFQNRFAGLAATAAALGAAAAAAAAMALKLAAGGSDLAPALPFQPVDLLWLTPLPIAAAVTAALTARSTVLALLRRMGQ